MKAAELLALLEAVDGDAEVRLAFQPNYPMQYNVGTIVEVDLGVCADCEGEGLAPHVPGAEEADCPTCQGSGEIRVVLGPVGPGAASRELGWR